MRIFSTEIFYSFVILFPAVLAVLQLCFEKRPKLRDDFIRGGSIFYGFLVLLQIISLNGQLPKVFLFNISTNLEIALKLDGLSQLFLFVVALLWPAATIYSTGYMNAKKEGSLSRFYLFYFLAIFATCGVILSANFVTLYLFYELLSLSTYPLVVHHQDKESKQAGRKYLAYILGPSILLILPAMVISYSTAGYQSAAYDQIAPVLVLMLVFGFSKAALVPFHSWLPGAMVAPTPVSALLHAVAVVKVGVFSVLRVIHDVYGIEYLLGLKIIGLSLGMVLSLIAAVSVLWPSLVALSQDSLKRRLAFSTIGQLAYITFAAFLLTKAALAAAAVHIVMHAFAKITLFFAAGAIYVAHGKKNISALRGLAYKMPYTFAAIAIGAAGVVGLPITGGFITKWNLLLGALDGNAWAVAVYLISSFLSAYYLFEIVIVGLKDRPKKIMVKEAPLACLAPIIFSALMTLVLFFIAGWLFSFANNWAY